MYNDFELFIYKLASVKALPDVTNQYSFEVKNNEVRRNNLLLYLTQIKKINPSVILVGEAPGFHGCRYTGVPFTSEHILLKNATFFGKDRGYEKTNECKVIKKESSSTMMWETLNEYNIMPLLWGAFPFHPYKKGELNKNRTPKNYELEIGAQFLKEIIELFDIEKIVAVGGVAESCLKNMNIQCKRIRHPANGGKQEFICGIKELIREVT